MSSRCTGAQLGLRTIGPAPARPGQTDSVLALRVGRSAEASHFDRQQYFGRLLEAPLVEAVRHRVASRHSGPCRIGEGIATDQLRDTQFILADHRRAPVLRERLSGG